MLNMKQCLQLKIVILLFLNIGIVLSFTCPKLVGEKGGLADGMKCGNRFMKLLTNICKFGFTDTLLKNLVKNVFFRAVKCVDESYEQFLIDEGIDCALTDSAKGCNMLADRNNFCDKSKQSKVQSCAISSISDHKAEFKKLVPYIPHLVVLCNKLADGVTAECKKMYPSFPNV